MTTPTPPPESTPPATVAPVVLWQRRADALGLPPAYVTGYHIATDAEYRALPVAAYTALMALLKEVRSNLLVGSNYSGWGLVQRIDAALGREGA